MKHTFLIRTIVILGAIPWFSPVNASRNSQISQPIPPVVLCMPGIYFYDPIDCAPTGPSAYLTRLAQKGFTFSPQPLPNARIDPALSEVNVHYGEVTQPTAPIFGSIEEAIKGNKKSAYQYLNGDFMFISYTDEQYIDNKHLYMVSPGAWMTAAYISRIGVLPRSQGVAFSRTPTTAFGWTLNYFGPTPLLTKRTPGSQGSDYTSHGLNLYDIVQIYDAVQVGNEEWYMVGPDEWVSKRYMARVTPSTKPPEGSTGDRWIEVNLWDQTLAVYDQRQLVFATVIASGADPFWTQPGLFQIREKLASTLMRGASGTGGDAYYLEDVPWTMYYDGPRALHGAYWRAKMGFPQSHGCVNMTVGDAHWLFDWAQVGDWVYVWDPSGQTPTDPSLYGSGGY
jgi:hypothetical protein